MGTVLVIAGVVGLAIGLISIPSSNPAETHGLTELFGSVYLEDLPDGLFRNLLTFFESLRSTYINVFDLLGNTFVSSLGYSPLSVFIGAGLGAYVSYVCLKFVVGLVTGS